MVIIDAYSYENDDEDIWCTAGYPDYHAYIFVAASILLKNLKIIYQSEIAWFKKLASNVTLIIVVRNEMIKHQFF